MLYCERDRDPLRGREGYRHVPGRGVRVQPGGDAAPVGEEGELFRPGGVQSQRDLRAAANVRTNLFFVKITTPILTGQSVYPLD